MDNKETETLLSAKQKKRLNSCSPVLSQIWTKTKASSSSSSSPNKFSQKNKLPKNKITYYHTCWWHFRKSGDQLTSWGRKGSWNPMSSKVKCTIPPGGWNLLRQRRGSSRLGGRQQGVHAIIGRRCRRCQPRPLRRCLTDPAELRWGPTGDGSGWWMSAGEVFMVNHVNHVNHYLDVPGRKIGSMVRINGFTTPRNTPFLSRL